MATVAVSPTLSLKIVWSWQSNTNPWNDTQEKEWKRYSDLEIDLIEEKYQKNEKNVNLGDYVIDFNEIVQHRKDDEHRQRAVKREIINVNQYLREERFGYVEQSKKAKSFGTGWCSDFIIEWQKRNKGIATISTENYPEIVEQAALGILKEGTLLNQDVDAQLIFDQLRKVKYKAKTEICVYTARVYSMESFLYKLVNRTLRNEDMSKVDSLGAYCYLLSRHLVNPNYDHFTVYRGCTLTNEMIEDYTKALGTWIQWFSFTSTSRSRQQAEQIGNTLFIISMRGILSSHFRKDISSLSQYLHEQEMLLVAGLRLKVGKVECDEHSLKYFIYFKC